MNDLFVALRTTGPAAIAATSAETSPESTSVSVTPSPSIQTVVQNHVTTNTSSVTPPTPPPATSTTTESLNVPSVSESRCSNKSSSSNEDGCNFIKIGSFGKAGVNGLIDIDNVATKYSMDDHAFHKGGVHGSFGKASISSAFR